MKTVLWQKLIWLAACLTLGTSTALLSSAFLVALDQVTNLRVAHPWLLFLLPMVGGVIAIGDRLYPPQSGESVAGMAMQLRQGGSRLAFLALPRTLLGTLLTHLGGGSAGREGTAILMAGVAADQTSKWFACNQKIRQSLLMAGAAAGFGTAIGTPLAGIIFAVEFSKVPWRQRLSSLPAILITCLAGQRVVLWLATPHTHYLEPDHLAWSFKTFTALAVAAVAFAVAVRLFMFFTARLKLLFVGLAGNTAWQTPLAGAVFVVLTISLTQHDYLGLGIAQIQQSLDQAASFESAWLKLFYTSLTLAGGFRGGEFTPLVFIGSHLGSWLAPWLGLPVSSLGALGFCALFSGAAKTPVTGACLALELFSPGLFWPAGLVCALVSVLSGKTGIYSSAYA